MPLLIGEPPGRKVWQCWIPEGGVTCIPESRALPVAESQERAQLGVPGVPKSPTAVGAHSAVLDAGMGGTLPSSLCLSFLTMDGVEGRGFVTGGPPDLGS